MKPDLPSAGEFAELAAQLHAAPTPAHTAESVIDHTRAYLGADFGGITLIRARGRLQTVAPSAHVVNQVDALQYELEEGPCRDTSWHGGTMISEDLDREQRWPRWAPKVVELGIRAALAVELTRTSTGERFGAINLFWANPTHFTEDDVAFAHIFSRHAALALASSMQEADLNTALDGRKLIGQAQGILMERFGLDEGRAFEVLRRYSQEHNIKLRRVAEILVSTRRLPESSTPAPSISH